MACQRRLVGPAEYFEPQNPAPLGNAEVAIFGPTGWSQHITGNGDAKEKTAEGRIAH